jgi:hypothetical protein
MGRTYRGLSKKDKERLKNGRLQRHKRQIHDEPEADNRRADSGKQKDLDRYSFDDEYYNFDEKRRRRD